MLWSFRCFVVNMKFNIVPKNVTVLEKFLPKFAPACCQFTSWNSYVAVVPLTSSGWSENPITWLRINRAAIAYGPFTLLHFLREWLCNYLPSCVITPLRIWPSSDPALPQYQFKAFHCKAIMPFIPEGPKHHLAGSIIQVWWDQLA